jgi:hypothetical protein
MQFIKKLALNLLILFAGLFVLYLFFPEIMGNVNRLGLGIFGPILLLLVLIVASLPGRRRGR